MVRQLLLIFSGLSVCLCTKLLREYYFVNSSKTWAEAQKYCRSMFNDLATVEYQDDSDELWSVLPDSDRYAWIGLHDDPSRWKWSKGDEDFNSRVDYKNWRDAQPDSKHSSQACVLMAYNGKWYDRSCEAKRNVLCLNEKRGSRFISVETKMTWEEAKNYCRSKYTDLAVVRNKEENKEITSLIRSKHWIGLYREVWSSWSDQTPASFTNWAQSQPNTNTSTAMSCAAADAPTGSWWDVDCDEQHPFICQNVSLPPVRKQTTFRLKFKLEANITRRLLKEQILKQETLETNEGSNVTLHWNEREGEVFQGQKKDKGWGC
ncbi:macrophage mannose receptor 1-like isoform X2 [Salarias fasciatus]|uniref:macrophage mannose receptor 1-like isoform X2 n=1 Tax=Salarias fasciatus TaxID=181472 RepID=UPI001176E788|nr:macrophage mannose receptor 1-like isoform X2 [Salarias fasciatus]